MQQYGPLLKIPVLYAIKQESVLCVAFSGKEKSLERGSGAVVQTRKVKVHVIYDMIRPILHAPSPPITD